MTLRHKAREAALQILYSCEIGGAPPADAADAFFHEHAPDAPEAMRAFATRLVHGAVGERPALDQLIAQHSHRWRLDRLAVIDRLILRLAIWELKHERDTPAAVVLNEAIELARAYSTDDSTGFVNGVLDGVRKALEAPGPRPEAPGPRED